MPGVCIARGVPSSPGGPDSGRTRDWPARNGARSRRVGRSSRRSGVLRRDRTKAICRKGVAETVRTGRELPPGPLGPPLPRLTRDWNVQAGWLGSCLPSQQRRQLSRASTGRHGREEDRLDFLTPHVVIVTLLVGGGVGWLASILMRSDAAGGVRGRHPRRCRELVSRCPRCESAGRVAQRVPWWLIRVVSRPSAARRHPSSPGRILQSGHSALAGRSSLERDSR
jgi:hypothetical protein